MSGTTVAVRFAGADVWAGLLGWGSPAEWVRAMVHGHPLLDRLGWTLVHSLWQGVLIAAGLWVALRVIRGTSARARYAAGCLSMVLLVAMPAVTFVRLGQIEAAGGGGVSSLPNRAPQPGTAGAVFLGAIPAPTPDGGASTTDWSPLTMVAWAWAVGVLVMGVLQIGGVLRLRWLLRRRTDDAGPELQVALDRLARRMNVRRPVRARVARWVEVPSVVGVLQPLILMPAVAIGGLSPAQVESLLAHELAHVRRYDWLVNWVQTVVEALMFYHPAVWYASGVMRVEREHCCDDVAAAACGDPLAYARALLAVEERRALPPSMALAAVGGGGRLVDRVARLLGKDRPVRRGGRSRSVLAAVVAITCVALPLAALKAQEKRDSAVAKEPTGTRAVNGGAATAGGGAGDADLDRGATDVQPDDLKPDAGDYKIGRSDLVQIKINDLAGPGVETVKNSRVTDRGMISMPLVGEVKIEGLTEAEAEKAIGGAYIKQRLIQNPQVSLTVTEARGRTFNVLGGVNRPGQYAISQNDFRMLDALTVAGGDVGGGRLYVLRPPPKTEPKEGAAAKDEAPAQPRKIRVPLDKLLAGEMKYNLVVRPGDTIVVAKAEERPMAVVVTKNGLTVDGQGTTWEGLDQTLAKLPEADRKRTVLRLVAGSEELTLGEYGRAKGRAAEIARRLGLARVEDVGLVGGGGGAKPADGGNADPNAAPRGAAPQGGEYYVGGGVPRPGVYTLGPNRTVTLKQALIGAGHDVTEDRGWVTLVRRTDAGAEDRVVDSVPMRELFKEGGAGATALAKGDTILVAPQDRKR